MYLFAFSYCSWGSRKNAEVLWHSLLQWTTFCQNSPPWLVPWTTRRSKTNPKGNQPWIFIGRTDAETEAPILWPPDSKSWLIGKGPDAGKDWRAGREGDDRGWDGWMTSLTQWTWVWASSGKWWRTEKPGVLQPMGSQSWTPLSNWTV